MRYIQKARIGNILKILFIVFALILFIAQTAVIFVPYQTFVNFLQSTVGFDITKLDFDINNANLSPVEALYITMQNIFYLIAVISAIVGTIVFSKGRSLLDAVGIFVAFLIPRKRKFSGTVYDVSKNQPIAFTSIRVIRKRKEKETVIASAITDLDGKYKIYLEEITESLYIQARASGYEIYEQELTGLYKNNVIQDIPLKTKSNVQSQLKAYYYSLRPRLINFLIFYLFILSILALILQLIGPLFIFGMNLVSGVYIARYVIAVIWNASVILERLRFRPGRILDYDKETPIPSAIVSILNHEQQLQAVFSDINGVVRVNLEPGVYKIKASRKGYEMVDEESNEIDSVSFIIRKDGYLPEDILMKKVDNTEENELSTDLSSPFS